MEADWEVEIGGAAPVIEALWPGFVDLKIHPERIAEIEETAACPALAHLLLVLNAPLSPVWTSKCDVWEPEPDALAAYIDVLPREGAVYAEWQQAECFCRDYVARLNQIAFPQGEPLANSNCKTEVSAESSPEYSIDLVIRGAIAGRAEGFGITVYFSARATAFADAGATLASVMAGFGDALPSAESPTKAGSKLQ